MSRLLHILTLAVHGSPKFRAELANLGPQMHVLIQAAGLDGLHVDGKQKQSVLSDILRIMWQNSSSLPLTALAPGVCLTEPEWLRTRQELGYRN